MAPEHARLAILLRDAAAKRGGQADLARALRLGAAEVSSLINGNRFVTMRQALRIEAVLGVRAEELLYEACKLKVDEELSKARGRK